jgi:fumarylacetoacetate (FAA) hydrolase
MIFATLHEGGRDGLLIIVNRARSYGVSAAAVAPTLQALLDNWDQCIAAAANIAADLEAGQSTDIFPLNSRTLAAPLTRSYQFLDGSAYPHHMSAIREARGAKMPVDFFEKPLMYQGLSDKLIGPTEPILLTEDDAYGVDIEAEVVVITGDVPQGVSTDEASGYVRLLGLLNDVSLRNIIPPELARGFGFLQGKSASSMGPFVVTPDEVGDLWNGKLLSGRYLCHIRGELIGDLDPGIDAAFTYPQLIAHASRTRELKAGTIIGAGALANADRKHGCGCIAELRAREKITTGSEKTPYLKFGDELRLEMFDRQERSIFGSIHQQLRRWPGLYGVDTKAAH